MGYLANFMVYTLAMVGIIAVALLIFKGATGCGGGIKSKYLKVLDTLSLAPRKTLYVVSTGREKFLIAGDVDKTTLISKLETTEEEDKNISDIVSSKNNDYSTQFELPEFKPTPSGRVGTIPQGLNQRPMSFQETMSKLPKSNFMDKTNIGIKSSMLSSKMSNDKSVIRSLAERIK